MCLYKDERILLDLSNVSLSPKYGSTWLSRSHVTATTEKYRVAVGKQSPIELINIISEWNKTDMQQFAYAFIWFPRVTSYGKLFCFVFYRLCVLCSATKPAIQPDGFFTKLEKIVLVKMIFGWSDKLFWREATETNRTPRLRNQFLCNIFASDLCVNLRHIFVRRLHIRFNICRDFETKIMVTCLHLNWKNGANRISQKNAQIRCESSLLKIKDGFDESHRLHLQNS